MLNHAAEIIQTREDGSNYEVSLELPSSNSNNSEYQQHGSKTDLGVTGEESTPNKIKGSSGSPNSVRRLLPTTPSFLNVSPKTANKQLHKSHEDLNTDTIMRKFRYDTIARKKRDKSKQRNSSTFYLDNDEKSISTTLSNSEDNISISSCGSPKLKKKDISPMFRKKDVSPAMRVKQDSPKGKIKDNNLLNQTQKKKAHKLSTSNSPDKQTHVALYKFFPRHKDELAFTDGDPIHVLKMYDDLWYEGINLLTEKQGSFPCRYVADILSHEIDSLIDDPSDHKQFFMRFLGSVEVQDHKGDEILLYAIARVVNQRSMLSSANPPTCVLQVSNTGVRICNMIYGVKHAVQESDKKNKKGKHTDSNDNEPVEQSHYFSLKNVTFCGNHPKDKRYFGFITKHPDEHRFACHILMSKYSTDTITKIFGECFEKFYTNFMEYRASTEDIYLE